MHNGCHACAASLGNCRTIELLRGTAGQWINLRDSPPKCGTLGNYDIIYTLWSRKVSMVIWYLLSDTLEHPKATLAPASKRGEQLNGWEGKWRGWREGGMEGMREGWRE